MNEEREVRPEEQEARPEATPKRRLIDRTIMVIDNPDCTEIFTNALGDEGAIVISGNLEINLNLLAEGVPDALVIDWGTIRTHPKFWEAAKPAIEKNGIPWILTSSFPERELSLAAQEQGASNFLLKPPLSGDLLEELIKQTSEVLQPVPEDSQKG
jgi:response regulator RpfG family c-di-GMP phosphodiesterase